MTANDLSCGVCFSEIHGIALSEIIEGATAQWEAIQYHEAHTKKERAN